MLRVLSTIALLAAYAIAWAFTSRQEWDGPAGIGKGLVLRERALLDAEAAQRKVRT
jgi:hypothetical protein